METICMKHGEMNNETDHFPDIGNMVNNCANKARSVAESA